MEAIDTALFCIGQRAMTLHELYQQSLTYLNLHVRNVYVVGSGKDFQLYHLNWDCMAIFSCGAVVCMFM